jgi:hypothetical protein
MGFYLINRRRVPLKTTRGGRPVPATVMLAGVFACGVSAVAATVTGEVYDLRTGEVLAGVKITVEETEAVSAADGSYRLYEIEPGRRLLVAKKKGYALLYDDSFIVGEGDETWANLGMLPLEPDSEDVKGDFLDLLHERAPRVFGEQPISADLYELPLRVSFDRRGGFISENHVRDLLEVQNKKLGGTYYAFAGEDDGWDVKLVSIGREDVGTILVENAAGAWYAVAPERETFFFVDPRNAGPGNVALMRGAELGDFYRLTGAYLRFVLLAGRDAVPEAVHPYELEDDLRIGTDLDAVVRLAYEAGPAVQLGKYTRSKRGHAAVLGGFSLGWGDVVSPGVYNAKGEELEFPTDYTLGYLDMHGGATYRGIVGAGGIWHTGIWGENAEGEASTGDFVVFKEIRRVKSFYGRGGYRWDAVDEKVSITPYGGYRYLKLEGYFHGERAAGYGDPPDTIISGVRRLDGPEVGLKAEWITGVGDLAFYANYAEFFGEAPSIHIVEGGAGAARWHGVGVYAFWRQFWNGTLDYRCGGIGFAGEFGL